MPVRRLTIVFRLFLGSFLCTIHSFLLYWEFGAGSVVVVAATEICSLSRFPILMRPVKSRILLVQLLGDSVSVLATCLG